VTTGGLRQAGDGGIVRYQGVTGRNW
jgi:hypothetical protein